MTLIKKILVLWLMATAMVGFAGAASAQSFPPDFSKTFAPDTIGPGSTSTLTFLIDQSLQPVAANSLAFTDTLPAGMTIGGGGAAHTCGSGTLTAPDGGTTITLAGGQVGAGATCTVTVDVTSSTVGVQTNVSGALTSDQGSSGTATDDLTVSTDRPGFSKSFAPSTVNLGGTTKLTFLIDNTLNASAAVFINFSDTMPAGMEVADPANAATTCTGGTIAAPAGGSTISYSLGSTAAFSSCEVSVEVIGGAPGELLNVSGDLTSNVSAINRNSGSASATLTVTGAPAGSVQITKDFTDDPKAGGSPVTLDFTLTNSSRDFAATSVAFTDDLAAMLAGTTYTSLESNDCGGTVSGLTTTTITFGGGAIAPEGTCTISTTVTPPAGFSGTFTNNTSAVTADIDGSSTVGNVASNDLTVLAAEPLVFSKNFLDDPVSAGDTTELEFTIENINPDTDEADATNISFTDDITNIAPFPATVILPGTACGGSLALVTGSSNEQILDFSGGILDEGATCSFSATITVDSSVAGATYTNTTSTLTADMGDSGVIDSPAASDTLMVTAAAVITLAKNFSVATAMPGDTVGLSFTLTSAPDSGATATNIDFTDPLGSFEAGTLFTSLDGNTCGATVTGLGTGTIAVDDASVAAAASCTIDTTITLPGGATPGASTNTTSGVTYDSGTLALTASAASADLDILDFLPITFAKAFLNNPVIAGDTSTLQFTIDNPDPTEDATITFFSDDLSAALAGLSATGAATINTCGGTLSGTTTLIYLGGAVSAGTNCTIEIDVLVPAAAVDGTYTNTTSSLSATQSGTGITVAPATDNLTVIGEPLSIIKEFLTDPVVGGNSTNLRFTIENFAASDATGIDFTDDLGAMLAGATAASAVTNTCGSMASGFPVAIFDYSSGSVLAGQTCIIEIVVDVPAVGATTGVTNTTSALSGTISGLRVTGTAATDTLTVTAAAASADISVTKSDGITSVVAGNSLTYTMVVSNAGPAADPSVAVADAFPAALSCTHTSTTAGGAFGNTAAGAGNIGDTLSMPVGSSVTYTADCSIDAATAPTTLSNTITATGSVGDPDTSNNSATDGDTTVTQEADISVTKDDGVTSVNAGESVTYTIIAANAGPSDNGSVSLSDTFAAELGCTYTSVAAGGASGNTAASGGDLAETLSIPVGGSVTYTAACALASSATGSLSNTASVSSSITDPAPGNDSATDVDTITQEADLSITKDDGLTSLAAGGTLTYTLIASNAGPSDDPSVSVADTFPGDLACTYTSVAAGGATGNSSDSGDLADTLSMPSGASVTYSATCMLDPMAAVGTLSNTATVTGSVTDPDSANNSATDNDTAILPAVVGFAKSFAPSTINQGEETVLTFTIDNSANVIDATGVAFIDDFDDPSVSGLVVASTPAVNNCGGTFTANSGDTAVELTGGVVGTGVTCTIVVTLRALLPGTIVNTTSTLTSNFPTAAQASDTLTVNAAAPPLFAKAFVPDTIDLGQQSALTFTIDNTANAIEATSIAFNDPFPPGLVVAPIPNVSSTCGGTLTANAGDASVSFAGGTVAEAASCTISVSVQALDFGALDNVTDALTSSLGDSGTASASLSVNSVPLLLSMSFLPSTIEQGQVSTVTYAFRNVAAIAASSITFSDILPANVVIAAAPSVSTSCVGGTLTAPAGGSTIGYTGGGLAAGAGCTITVNVTSNVVGTYPDTTETQSSSLGTSLAASATLTVEAAANASVTFIQESDTDGTFSFNSSTPALTFLIEVSGGTGSFGPVTTASGTHLISASPPTEVALTGMTCDDANSTGDPATGILTLNLAPAEVVVCTFTAQHSLQKTVDTINRLLTTRAGLILSSEPDRNRRIDRLNRGSGNSSPLTFATGDLKSLLPFTAQASRGSGSYKFSTSLLQVRQAAAAVELAHGSTKDAVYVNNYRFDAWFEAQYKKYDVGADSEGSFAIAYIGADYLVSENVLVGALIQVDNIDDQSALNNSSASGTGWMVSPYITARLAPKLYFDARLAAGTANNKVSPFNTYTDSFTSHRWMAMASLTGEFQQGAVTIRPNASLSYFEETADSYVDSVGTTIPSQTVRLGQLQIGPTFSTQFEGEDGMLYSPFLTIDAIYNLGETTGVTLTNPTTPLTEGWRGRLKAGVTMTSDAGTRVAIGGAYDGIGRSDFESWGLSFDVTIPLKKPMAR